MPRLQYNALLLWSCYNVACYNALAATFGQYAPPSPSQYSSLIGLSSQSSSLIGQYGPPVSLVWF